MSNDRVRTNADSQEIRKRLQAGGIEARQWVAFGKINGINVEAMLDTIESLQAEVERQRAGGRLLDQIAGLLDDDPRPASLRDDFENLVDNLLSKRRT